MTDSPPGQTTDDVEVPAPSGRPTYTDAELRAAFDKVKNRNNWKMPIRRTIDEADLDVTGEAIIYFAGCMMDAEPHPTRPGKWRIYAIGYYAAVGS